MRKLLLATSALAGAALFAGTAQADMEVTVGGYTDFRAGFFSEDLSAGAGVGRRHVDFENEYQLEVEAKAKANNGMEYGAVASLWNGADVTSNPAFNAVKLHQAYGYVNGAWGQVRAGDEHGVSDFAVAAPMTYDFGAQVDGYYTEFLSTGVFAITPSFVDDDENDTKVTYMTPKLGSNGHSIQAGVSYAPNFYDPGQSVVLTTSNGTAANPQYRNHIEAGARYDGTWFNKINSMAGFVLHTAESSDNSMVGLTPAVGRQARDFTSWNIGAQLGYAGFTVGGGYTDAGRFNTVGGQNNDQYAWNVGLGYKFDRASLAGSYLQGAGYNNTGFSGAALSAGDSATPAAWQNYSSSYEAWGVGAGYSLFDGMTTSVDAVFFNQDRPGGFGDNDGHVVILSNRVAF